MKQTYSIYNAFQYAVSGIAIFSGGYLKTAACFVAGTLVATKNGLVAIETIKDEDYVLSTDPDTMEIEYKPVLETYVRKVDKLVHITIITINGEEIVTTDNHPFYVQDRGFIEAGKLLVGDKLVSVNGEDLDIEDYHIELTEESILVYNFQVEDFHTYFVGKIGVLVHNSECGIQENGYVDAEKIVVENGSIDRNISQLQVSPGGGRHGSQPYVKISTTDQGIIKVVTGDETLYQTDGLETATIIFTE